MIKEELEAVLEKISIKDSDSFIMPDFINTIKEKMPGWDIEVWDCDDYPGVELTDSVAYHIFFEMKDGITNIQFYSWKTDCEDVWCYVVASKKD